jgi:hypothetical protein
MTTPVRSAIAGFVLLLPAVILVSTGFLGLDSPRAVVNPVLVMGGLLVALLLNAMTIVKVSISREGTDLVGTMTLRLRGTALNVGTLAIGSALLITILIYAFVENFQARPIG